MDYIYSIILATVQAVTEFLPISSSGHLLILHQVLKSDLTGQLTFDVILHGGTLLAVVIYFWQDILKIIGGLGRSIARRRISADFNEQLPYLLIIGTLPALAIGYFFDSLIEQFFRSAFWVILMLVLGGVLFIVFERFAAKKRNFDSLSFFDSLMIGLAQVLAFIPGVSRSGVTILAGLGLGLKREAAARFSFLLSVPVILGAVIRKVAQISLSDFSLTFIFVSILGAAVSALFGFLVIKYFLQFVRSHSLTAFAVYRFLLAVILILIFYF